MRAIPTDYSGVRFRSRTEARWAVLLDGLGVEWRYEHEGFQLPSGWYVPDFWLPGPELWIEVKGQDPTERELTLCRELADATSKDVALFRGDSCAWFGSADRASPVRFWNRLMEASEPDVDLLAALESSRIYRFWDPPAKGPEAPEPNATEPLPRSDALLIGLFCTENAIAAYAGYSLDFATIVLDSNELSRFASDDRRKCAESAILRAADGQFRVDPQFDWSAITSAHVAFVLARHRDLAEGRL